MMPGVAQLGRPCLAHTGQPLTPVSDQPARSVKVGIPAQRATRDDWWNWGVAGFSVWADPRRAPCLAATGRTRPG